MMKIKQLVVQVAAGLALSGLFAAGANAKETGASGEGVAKWGFCGYMDPAENAWFLDPSHSAQERNERAETWKAKYCVIAAIPTLELDEAIYAIGACRADSMAELQRQGILKGPGQYERTEPWTKAEIAAERKATERCVAAWDTATIVKTWSKQRASKQNMSISGKGRHRSTQPKARIALAP